MLPPFAKRWTVPLVPEDSWILVDEQIHLLLIYRDRRWNPRLDRCRRKNHGRRGKNNGSYAEAVKLLGKIRDLMTRLERADQFAGYLATVRAAHKPERNFIKLAVRL